MKEIILKWNGPYKIGCLPESGNILKKMQKPGVYILTMEYPDVDKKAVYAGKSNNVLWRVQQHITGHLGLLYWVRNDEAIWLLHGENDKRFKTLNNVDTNIKFAIREAKRVEFFYAMMDEGEEKHTKPIESLLINRVVEIAEQSTGNIIRDNSRREGYGKNSSTIKLIHDFSRVTRRSKKGKEALANLMGKAPLVGPPK